MRIAYISIYQGPGLLKRRPIVRNRSLANTTKLQTIASILRANAHDLEILSQGEVVENSLRFHPAFREPEPFHPEIPVFYASAWPIRRLNALWSSFRLLKLFRARHRAAPFDVAIIWNLKHPQVICAQYALRRLRIPAVLEYEDEPFVTIAGEPKRHSVGYNFIARKTLREFSGCIACSPHLLSQAPEGVPKLLLRGVVGADLIACSRKNAPAKQNRVLFSGTHCEQYGLGSLIRAWRKLEPAGWELHVTGEGRETPALKAQAQGCPSIQFHGFVSREELVRLMCSVRFCINPHELSKTPGNVFAFKIIEYLAAGAHVLTTPMGVVEPELEQGITYMADNTAESIAATLKTVIAAERWKKTAAAAVIQAYGPEALSASLETFLQQVVTGLPRGRSAGARQTNPVALGA